MTKKLKNLKDFCEVWTFNLLIISQANPSATGRRIYFVAFVSFDIFIIVSHKFGGNASLNLLINYYYEKNWYAKISTKKLKT